MVRNQKLLSSVANRAQMRYKTDSETLLGLTDVEEATSGAADAVDQVDGCAGEPLFNVEVFVLCLEWSSRDDSLVVRGRVMIKGAVGGGVRELAPGLGYVK
eukprot:g43652.t1